MDTTLKSKLRKFAVGVVFPPLPVRDEPDGPVPEIGDHFLVRRVARAWSLSLAALV
jgi:hypothetical protein